MAWIERFRDSAYSANIPADWGGGVAGYLSGGDPYHVWNAADWARFPRNRKLPIFVRSNPGNASGAMADAQAAMAALYYHGVPSGKYVALDVETAKDPGYVDNWCSIMQHFRCLPIAYGSASTLFANPAPRYWVADYRGTGPFMHAEPGHHVIMTQYASPATGSGGQWDSSTCAPWQYFDSGRWWI